MNFRRSGFARQDEGIEIGRLRMGTAQFPKEGPRGQDYPPLLVESEGAHRKEDLLFPGLDLHEDDAFLLFGYYVDLIPQKAPVAPEDPEASFFQFADGQLFAHPPFFLLLRPLCRVL